MFHRRLFRKYLLNKGRAWVLGIAGLLALDLGATAAYNAWAGNLFPRAGADLRALSKNEAAVDAVLVFCAGIGPHQGLDATTVERLAFAARLYREGRAGVVAGIGGHWRENRAAGLRRGMSEILTQSEGLPAEAAIQDHDSYDTFTNLDEVFRLVSERGWRRVAFVSSPLHLQRVLYLSAKREAARSAAIASDFVLDASVDAISEHPRLEIESLPFTASGQASLFAAWRETHHEWAAWALTLALPERYFRDVMRWRRL